MVWRRMILASVLALSCAAQAQASLANITIKSDEAICTQDPSDRTKLHMTYQGNVRVHLAGDTVARTQKLSCVICYHEKQHIEMLQATGGITFESPYRSAQADEAVIDLSSDRCTLRGNVRLMQEGNAKQLTVATHSDEVVINLGSKCVTSSGTSKRPVHTVINVADTLRKKKKGTP